LPEDELESVAAMYIYLERDDTALYLSLLTFVQVRERAFRRRPEQGECFVGGLWDNKPVR
jgi:hypothetical protein